MMLRTAGFAAVVAFALSLTTTSAWSAPTLLLNGDFEDTTAVPLGGGVIRFTGWTFRPINNAIGDIFLEGTNGISSFDVRANRFDGATSAAPDPYFPYISEADPRLDHFGYVRPSGPAPLSSIGEMYSDVFTIDSPITADVWREALGAYSEVQFLRASDNALLGSFLVTTAAQQWSRMTFDTRAFLGVDAYMLLRGGTNQAGFGWLTLFDNISGGVTQPVPEPSTLLLGLGALGLLVLRGRLAPA